MEPSLLKVIENVECCLLPKLARNYDESESHTEYEEQQKRLEQYFPAMLKLLEEVDLKQNFKSASNVLASILILFYELQSSGPWNAAKSKEYANKLNSHFALMYKASLDDLLRKLHTIHGQEVFDQCLEKLHQKMTSDDFKKYPSLIEVYCSLVQDVQNCKLIPHPQTTLPISLLLIDDFNTTNKIKGLKCCGSILQSLSSKDFAYGNYYEVIYGCLMKAFSENDLEVTKLVINCFLELLRILPSSVKPTNTADLYSDVLEQLYTESNLYRKAALFGFVKNIIQIHGVNCVSQNKFKILICDNIDACCNDAVGEILIKPVIEALEEWIKYCWCTWQLSTDQKLLSVLFKCLYACNEEISETLIHLIVTLVGLCTEEEQKQILKSLDNLPQIKSEKFHERINLVKKYISV